MTEYEKKRIIAGWLEDYDAMRMSIKNLNEMVKDRAEANMGVDTRREKTSQTFKTGNPTEDAVIHMSEIDIEGSIKRMQMVITLIDRGLEVLSPAERVIIIDRCMHKKCYYEFCGKLHMSERSAKRLKTQALEKLVIMIFGKKL